VVLTYVATFMYRFPIKQSGTYWYHSHSGGQEMRGIYASMILDPLEPEPFHYDRDYVVELRMGVAETYDVIVEPTGDRAYTIFAETLDRSGYARGTLAPRPGMRAEIPERRPHAALERRRNDDAGHGVIRREAEQQALS